MKKATDYLKEFDAIALKEDKEAAIYFLKNLPKDVKVSFRKGLLKLDKIASDYQVIELQKGHFQYKPNRTTEYKEVLLLGAIATCTAVEMKKFESGKFSLFTAETERMIAHFKPTWLTGIINGKIGSWWRLGSFLQIKEYQEKGYIGEVELEVRAERLREQPVFWLDTIKLDKKRTRQELSKRYNELSEKEFNWIKADLELLFKYDLAFGDNYGGNRGRWQTILQDWTNQEKIERSQLITWTLDTFTRPFNRQTGSFFRKYLDSFALSLKEKLAIQDRYIEMLSNANPHHVSYALKEIKKLEKSADFNNENLVENLEAVLVADSKGIVKNALMLLERTAKKKKELIPEICIAVLLALVSEENDIQKRVLTILEKIAPKGDEKLSDELMIYFENIHPSLQPSFQPFLSKTHQESSSVVSQDAFQIQKIPVLSTKFKLQPIENWDDWIYLAGSIYENKSPKIADVERLFESAVRLSSELSVDVLERMKPLIQRIKKTRNTYWYEPKTLTGAFINMIYWIFKTEPKEWKKVKRKAFLQFDKRSLKHNFAIKQLLYHRFLMYLKLVFKRTSLPVLSIPTHHEAWIDPVIFIEKLQIYLQQNQMPLILDLAYALTKLNLESTEEASKLAQNIKGKLGEIIHFVLGNTNELIFNENAISTTSDDESKIDWVLTEFSEQPKATAILYLNAFRTRFPQQNMSNFKAFGYETYFNTAEVGRYTWDSKQRKDSYKDYSGNVYQTYTRNSMVIETVTNNFFPSKHELFTLFLYQHLWVEETLFSVGLFNMKWLISLLPNNTESIFSFYNQQFGRLAADYEDVETNKSSRVILRAIIDFNIPLKHMGTFFIACATSYTDKVSRGMATEVLIHLLNQNTLDLPLFSTELGKLVCKGYGKLQRILPCLQQVSDVSGFHAKAMQTIVENMLQEFPTDQLPRNTKKLLELLLNLSLKNNQPTDLLRFEKQMPIWMKNSNLKKLIKQFPQSKDSKQALK